MLCFFKEGRSTECRPSIKFYKLFLIIFGISSFFSTTSVKYHQKNFNLFIFFELITVSVSVLTYLGTYFLIGILKNKGLVGTNLNGLDSEKKVPEPGALVGCVMYLLLMMLLSVLHPELSKKSSQFNRGLISIFLMTLLGLTDDILKLNWWTKILGPILASLPLCVAYCGTKVKGNKYLPWFPNREPYDQILACSYIVLLTVFCTNSINIYAGINGLEVGQSLVMAFFIIVYNSMEMYGNLGRDKGVEINLEKRMYTLYLTLPFVAINIGMLCFNWYPAKMFVGNVYTLFSGSFFSVVSILGELWEIMPFIFVPQLINFFISLPQLIGIMECPRHRVPKINKKTNKLEYSKNLTLINLFLYVLGPMKEETLTICLVLFQALWSVLGLIVKFCVN